MFATSHQLVNEAPGQSKSSVRAFDRQVAFPNEILSRAAIAAGLFGSLALLPLVIAQGTRTRRRVQCLPPATPPYHGSVPGVGKPIRLLAIGESTVCGVGLASGDEFGRRHDSAGAHAHDRPSDRLARRGAFRGDCQGCKEGASASHRT